MYAIESQICVTHYAVATNYVQQKNDNIGKKIVFANQKKVNKLLKLKIFHFVQKLMKILNQETYILTR